MNYRKLILALLLLVLFLSPRFSSLKSFVTVDEPFWLSVGANFYYALGQREFQNTVYEYHPAVTTMWFVTGGFLLYFPEFRGFGQGYFDVDKNKFDPFLLAHDKSPLQLLFFSRLLQLGLIALLMLAIFHLLSKLVRDEFAFLVSGLMVCAPFFLGHSLVLNHEALLAVCALTSIFGMLVYLDFGRRLPYLLLSAAAAALAQLTKSSALAFLPVIALMLLVSLFQNLKNSDFSNTLFDHLKIFGIWLGVLALVYIVVWPGMWVAPGRMLYEVYGNAFSYAFQGARLQVTGVLQPANFSLDEAGPVFLGFFHQILWRSTPILWLGVLLAAAGFFLRGEAAPTSVTKQVLVYLVITALLFILMFSLARGRNQMHYIMTSHVSLEVIAGFGWVLWIQWLVTKWRRAGGLLLQVVFIVILLGLQIWSTLAFRPYFYTYFNPWMSLITSVQPGYGYGEGMELAASYLSAKPDSGSTTVLAYHGRGPFSYYYPGQTILLNPLWLEEPGMAPMVERMLQSDYLVFYDEFAGRSARTRQFVDALEGIQPEKVILVQNLERILVYRVADLPQSFYESIVR